MARKRTEPLKPLRHFDYKLVGERMEGVFINIDRDLQRRLGMAERGHNVEAGRSLSLLNVLLRFAWNSYHAVTFIAGDIPEIEQRRPNYVLIVPNINRQLLDLLFSLAYMLDDFPSRSLQYQRAG